MVTGGRLLTVRSDGISWQQVDDEIVVLDLEESRYLSFNGSAGVLWKRLAESPVDVDDLAQLLVGVFDVDRAIAAEDATEFASQCAAFGLLE